MEMNQNTENMGKEGSGIFLWIFIGINIAFAIIVVIKIFLG